MNEREDPEVAFLATGRESDCGIATYTTEIAEALTVSTERVPLKLGSGDPLHYLVAGWRAGRTGADVLHVQHEYGIYGPKSIHSWPLFCVLGILARLRGLPVVVTFHSAWSSETVGPPLYPLKVVYVALNNRLLAGVADHALFLSEETRETFEGSAPLENVSVLPHGVPTPRDGITDAKAEFGYDSETSLVVEPGFVRPEKGYETFVELAAAMPETAFVVGGGAQTGADEAYASSLRESFPPNVEMTGVLDEERFHALFEAMDVAVLPYETVTQSGVVNWCIAYDVPIVATDRPRFESLHDRYGFPRTFPADDVAAGVTAIREALATPEETRAGRRAFERDHGLPAVAADHESLYRELAAPPTDTARPETPNSRPTS